MMTSYTSANSTGTGYSLVGTQNVELRVISNLLQREMSNMSQDELRILRNDQAFELGLPVPVPGT